MHITKEMTTDPCGGPCIEVNDTMNVREDGQTLGMVVTEYEVGHGYTVKVTREDTRVSVDDPWKWEVGETMTYIDRKTLFAYIV